MNIQDIEGAHPRKNFKFTQCSRGLDVVWRLMMIVDDSWNFDCFVHCGRATLKGLRLAGDLSTSVDRIKSDDMIQWMWQISLEMGIAVRE